MSLNYASGPDRYETGIPSSNFSRGGLLGYDSASSLSGYSARLPVAELVGIAMADSNQSINNQVPYLVLQRDTVLWSDATTGSQLTRGERVNMELTVGVWRASSSNDSPLAIIDSFGASDDVQSATSRVRLSFDPDYLVYGT